MTVHDPRMGRPDYRRHLLGTTGWSGPAGLSYSQILNWCLVTRIYIRSIGVGIFFVRLMRWVSVRDWDRLFALV